MSENAGPGYVKVFDFNADDNDWDLRGDPITPVVIENFAEFGAMVAMSGNGNRIAVVATRDNFQTSSSEDGFILVYDWNSTESEWEAARAFINWPKM